MCNMQRQTLSYASGRACLAWFCCDGRCVLQRRATCCNATQCIATPRSVMQRRVALVRRFGGRLQAYADNLATLCGCMSVRHEALSHITRSMQQTACNIHHHTTYMQHAATGDMQHAAYTCNRVTCSAQRATLQLIAPVGVAGWLPLGTIVAPLQRAAGAAARSSRADRLRDAPAGARRVGLAAVTCS
jgi:hypothetical protein